MSCVKMVFSSKFFQIDGSNLFSSRRDNRKFDEAGLRGSNFIFGLLRKYAATRRVVSSFKMFVGLCSAFFNHIVNIIIRSADKQMIRINTKAVVAVMTNVFIFWYGTESKKPRNSVSPVGAATSDGYFAITSAFTNRCLPKPASRRFCDFFPKSFGEGPFFARHKRVLNDTFNYTKERD